MTGERALVFSPQTGADKDLDGEGCLRLAIQHAFPLPKSGAFADLLAALNASTDEPQPQHDG